MRQESASAYRNETPIKDVLANLVGEGPADILEIASGTGQHSAAFCSAFPQMNWWPTDYDAENLPSIEAWRVHSECQNLQKGHQLDVTFKAWRTGAAISGLPDKVSGMFCANMVHISPWAATEGLFEGAAHRVTSGGFLYIYGPYAREGRHTSDGNEQFDASLRARNPEWGIRNLEDVQALGEGNGLTLSEIIQMPANNLSLIFRS